MNVATVVYLGLGSGMSAMMSFTVPLPSRHSNCMISSSPLVSPCLFFISIMFYIDVAVYSDLTIITPYLARLP